MSDPTESRAVAVTFFEDRAQVTRQATVRLEAGRHDVEVAGITVLADDTSLVVRFVDAADGRVLTSRLHRRMRTVKSASDEEVEALDRDRQAKLRELDRARRKLALQGNVRDRVTSLEQSLLRAMHPVPVGEKTDAASWREALQRLDSELDRVEEEYADTVDLVADARQAEARATLLLEQARSEHPEIDAVVEVQVEVPEEGEYLLELEYYTPCALWRPSHIARLSPDRDEIDLTMLGTVWQQTGERWDDVRCSFSTSRPTAAAEAPLIEDDWLRSRPKTEQERRVVQVESRDVDIASTGSELAGQVDEMPGVDDGGEPLLLEALETVEIPSTGEPFRVEIESVEVPCDTDLVAYPERSRVPFLRARGAWTHHRPLLAGPVVVMRGNEYAGRSRIDFVAAGETFELGFGVDSTISIQRALDDEHKTTAVTGKNILHRTIKIFLSNLSSEKRYLTVIERVPVSEIDEVTVKKIDSEVPPDTDGFIEFAAELGPRAVETREISYRVEYGSKVRLTW